MWIWDRARPAAVLAVGDGSIDSDAITAGTLAGDFVTLESQDGNIAGLVGERERVRTN